MLLQGNHFHKLLLEPLVIFKKKGYPKVEDELSGDFLMN